MNELILVLEENPEIQAVISASLKDSPIFINQELNPDFFLQQVQNLNPDLIFISNSDSEQNYNTCRKIREESAIKNIPVILLVNAKDEIDEDLLRELQINEILRKPFEASMLNEQISKYISLDENFGAEPDKDNDNFAFDMSSIDSDLKEIKQQNHSQSQIGIQGDLSYSVSSGSNMDSLVLEDILIDNGSKSKINPKEDILKHETEKTSGVNDLGTDDEYNYDLKSEEKPENDLTETDLVPRGLEKLKLSGLEEKYAEGRLFKKNDETEQKLRSGLTDIDLENNDFEDPSAIWLHPPDIDQTPREGLTDINLKQTEFHPSFPKHLAPLEETAATRRKEDEDIVEQITDLDNSLLKTGNEEYRHVNGNVSDDMLLTDSEDQESDKDEHVEESKQMDIDSTLDEFDEGFFNIRDADDEINSMVNESIEDQEITTSEIALEELEDLSLQMVSLEAEEDELEAEEKEFEKDLEKGKILEEGKTAEFQENELTEFMVDELGDLLELDEDEDSDDMELNYSSASEIPYALEEEVFDSWDDAEDAFMGFEKDSVLNEDADLADTEKETESIGKDYYSYKEGRYSFNEDELKHIVTSSVQNALEKSIASSLVELAVSEIKNNVSERI